MKKTIISLAGLIFLISSAAAANPITIKKAKALIIGISQYQTTENNNPGKPKGPKNLRGPINDIKLIKENILPILYPDLPVQTGQAKEKIKYELDIKELTDAQATRENIRKAISWLARGQNIDNRFFYFAGHGDQIRDTNKDEEDSLDEVILPFGAEFNQEGRIKPETAITDDDLRTWFEQVNLNRKKLFAVLDTCHAGDAFRSLGNVPGLSIVGTRWAGMGMSASPLPDVSRDPIPQNHIYLYASQSNQPAREREFGGRFQGFFTTAFANAVNRLTSGHPGKSISYLDIYTTTDQIMKTERNLDQTPDIQPMYRGKDAEYKNTDSQRLLNTAFVVPEKKQAAIKPFTAQLPDLDQYRTNVLIIHQGSKIISSSDFNLVKNYANIDFKKQNKDYTLYITINQSKNLAELTNENGYRLNTFTYTNSNDLKKKLIKRIRHQYLKDLLAQIRSSNGFPLSIGVLDYHENPYVRNDFYNEQRIFYKIKSQINSYVYILSVDAGDQMNLLFPYEGQKKNFIRKGAKIMLPDKRQCIGCVEQISSEPGEVIMKIIATPAPLKIQKAEVQKLVNDDELLTAINFEQAVKIIRDMVSQLKQYKDWYAGTKRYMNYSFKDYKELYK